MEGLDFVKQNPVDLIITDIVMPKMEGIELIMNLRRDFPKIKIIAISGGKPYYLYMAKKLGIDGIFTKPLNHQAFLQAVKRVIQYPATAKEHME
jgi:YesN/AraC family two-component response regulator